MRPAEVLHTFGGRTGGREADVPSHQAIAATRIEIAYKAELKAAEDPDAHLAAIKQRLNRVRSPFRSAELFEIEQVIDPRETRTHLCRWVNLARRSLRPGLSAFSYRP